MRAPDRTGRLQRRDREVPPPLVGGQQPLGLPDVDEPRPGDPEPFRDRAHDLDLETAREEHLPPPDHARLQRQVSGRERDDELRRE